MDEDTKRHLDHMRMQLRVAQSRANTTMGVAVGGVALGIVGCIFGMVTQMGGGGLPDKIDVQEIHCRALRVSSSSENPDHAWVMMPALGMLYQHEGKMIWSLEGTSQGPSETFFDRDGNIRLIVGCAETTHKTTGDETLSSAGTVTIFKANGDVLRSMP